MPLVNGAGGDPVGAGLVSSLARPGGNITGFSLKSTEVVTKRLQLSGEIVPGLTRLAFLWDPNNASIALQFKETEAAGRAVGVQVQSVEVTTVAQIEAGMLAAAKARADAIFASSDAIRQLTGHISPPLPYSTSCRCALNLRSSRALERCSPTGRLLLISGRPSRGRPRQIRAVINLKTALFAAVHESVVGTSAT